MNTSRIGLAVALLTASAVALAQAPSAEPAAGAAPVAPAPELTFTDDYEIVVDDDAKSDGEKIIIERSGGKQDTSLVVVSSTVMGITVKVHED